MVYPRLFLVILVIMLLWTSVYIVLKPNVMVVVVRGSSMEPMLKDGDRVLVLHIHQEGRLRRGDVVVGSLMEAVDNYQRAGLATVQRDYIAPGPMLRAGDGHDPCPLYIKRVVGLPGDEIPRSSNQWDEISEHRKSEETESKHGIPQQVPDNHVFLVGDAPGLDSRTWGPVPIAGIKGTVVARISRFLDHPRLGAEDS